MSRPEAAGSQAASQRPTRQPSPPYLVRISIGRIPMGPNALRFSESVLAILQAGGLPPRLAGEGHPLLIATLNRFPIPLQRPLTARGKKGHPRTRAPPGNPHSFFPH